MSDSCKKRYILVPDSNLTKGEKGDKGDPGQDASFILPLSTDDVLYGAQVLTDVIDELLYEVLGILSFTASQTIYEKGQVLNSIGLTWSYNKDIESQTITGTGVVPPTLLVSDRSKTVTLSGVSTNTTIILTADDVIADGNPSKTANINLQFLNKIYYGKAIHPGTINSAFLLGLSFSNLQSNRVSNFTVNTGANEYIWFALPEAYGVPTFYANGFEGGFVLENTFSFINASGHTENYRVYRSEYTNLGSTIIETL
jgi:hypothetical protein